jgi:2-oxoglutarate ferredoxin oxidoreductase subunit gamma
MRGGTANSTVIISDEEIGSPVFVHPSILIAMNEQSLNKFLPKMKDGTTVIYNSSLSKNKITYKKLKVVEIPATEFADKKIGNVKTANIIMLGALLKTKGILSIESAKKACQKAFEGKKDIIEINHKALALGYTTEFL